MATYRVKPTHAGDYSGSSWANAMGWAEFATSIVAASAGDIYYIMEGSYTMTASVDASARAGSNVDPISVIGVNDNTTNEDPVYADWSVGFINGEVDDRPIITTGTYTFTTPTFTKMMNITMTGTSTTMFSLYNDSTAFNCKVINSSGTADRYCFYVGNASTAYLCEACGVVGTGVVCRGFYGPNILFFCYAHDCNSGFYFSSTTVTTLLHCIAEDCALYGIYGSTTPFNLFNCSINDCAIGVYTTTPVRVGVNNILEGCTTSGFNYDAMRNFTLLLKNHGDDARNTDMWLNVPVTAPHYDPFVTTGDPLFDADGNLSLKPTSPCLNTGLSMLLGT